jgi:hypothetical protein
VTLEEMFDQNGYWTEEVNGEQRYVTTDGKGRSVIGPRRRGRRKLFGGRPHTQSRAVVPAQIDEGPTVVVRPYPEVVRGTARVRSGWWRRQKAVWTARFYDRDWHAAVQHTGVDVMIWVMGVSVSAVFVKAAYWVVTL